MPKLTEFLSNIFTKPSQLQTDAAIIPDKNNINIEEDDNTQNQSSTEFQQTLTNASSVSSEISPLKQHMLVTQCEGTVPNTNHISDQNLSSVNNNVLTGTINNIQRQNVMQFSNMNGLHIGNAYNFNSSVTSRSSPTNNIADNQDKRVFKKTKTIEAMMKSKEPLEFRTINVIAEHMQDWEDIARKLQFSEGQIQHFALDNYIKGSKEIIYQLLLDWSQNDDDASLGMITRILWKNKNQQAVFYLKELWKTIPK